ncbi:MAG: ABC transporter ATP-binding protein [Crocinitomicaceae bacterium]|nr:ABC transporter ATP-binding protein [Crocinitomicaceae bacterium]
MSEKKKLDIHIFFRLFSYTKPYRTLFAISLVSALIVAFLGPYRVALIGDLVNDHIVENQDREVLKEWSIILTALLFGEILFQFLSQYLSNLLGQKIIYEIRVNTFKKIIHFNSKYFDKTPIGSLVTRVISDIEAIADVFSQGIFSILTEALKIILVFYLMFMANWKFGLLVIIPIPILFIATKIFANAMKKANQKERTQVNRLNTFVQERLNAINLIKIFNREQQEYDHFKEINKDHRQAHINAVWAFSIFLPVVEILSSLSIAFLILWGVLMFNYEPENTGVLFGQIFAFVLWVHMLYRPIRQLADRFNTIQRGVVRAERVFKVLDTQQEIQKTGDKDLNGDQLSIEFKNIYFAYNDENWVLKDLNLKIEKGQNIAIVGATGSGKTSIINLIPRFYEYQKGQILINETEITEFKIESLRTKLGIVVQDVFLFSDTLYNNIVMGDFSITKEQVLQAAKDIGIEQLIQNLPGQLDYVIGERGGILSIGQRQLLSFLRAYVKNPEILILDEATANIDVESEELIKKATTQITKGRTSIIIAHRLSTIKNVDKIIVLDKGKILESGTHDELIAKGGAYAHLFEIQFKELEEAKG